MIRKTHHDPGFAQHELEIGRDIQLSFLPDALPQPSGWEIAARFEAAREVAGDFYDAFTLANSRRVGLVVADVCDKGVGAALFMALFRTLIRAFADQHYSLGWMDVLSDDPLGAMQRGSVQQRRTQLSAGTTALRSAVTLTNRYVVLNHGKSNMFATMFVGILDPDTGSLIYINAGHESAFVLGPTGVRARLEATSPAVGLMAGLEFRMEQTELAKGDILLAYTDGVVDARNPHGERFGDERLTEIVQAPSASAEDLVNRIASCVEAHSGGAVQYDDITLLVVRRLP